MTFPVRTLLRSERRAARDRNRAAVRTNDEGAVDYTLPSTLPHRMLKYGVMWVDDDYGPGWEVRTRDLTTNPAKAELISSRISERGTGPYKARTDMHAPALDLDTVTAILVPTSTPGISDLYLDAPLLWGQYRRLLRALARAGIIDKDWAKQSIRAHQTLLPPPWRVGATKARGHEDAHNLIQTRHQMLREHHNPTGSGTVLTRVHDRGQATYVSSRMAVIKNYGGAHCPALRLTVPAAVVASTSPGHSHLYIDAPMNWPAYKRLLRALARAGVIDKNWAQASIKSGYTSLGPPWKIKPSPSTGASPR